MNVSICPDCQAPISEVDGPTHEYMGAPAGCWKIFGDVLEKEYSDREYWRVHRLTVDSYAAQHASGDDPRQLQSVTVHLIALYLSLEMKLSEDQVRITMKKFIHNNKNRFQRFEGPSFDGLLNIGDVVKARDSKEHCQLVEKWASDVWSAWHEKHDFIRALIPAI